MTSTTHHIRGKSRTCFISKKSFFCFSATAPLLFGLILVPFTSFHYYEISFICILELSLLFLILLFFDIIATIIFRNSSIYNINYKKHFNKELFKYISLFLLSIVCLGFLMKLKKYGLDYNPVTFIYIIVNSPQNFAEKFSAGYSTIHYSGLLLLKLIYLVIISKSF